MSHFHSRTQNEDLEVLTLRCEDDTEPEQHSRGRESVPRVGVAALNALLLPKSNPEMKAENRAAKVIQNTTVNSAVQTLDIYFYPVSLGAEDFSGRGVTVDGAL